MVDGRRGEDRRRARARPLLQHPARRRQGDRDQPADLDSRLPGGLSTSRTSASSSLWASSTRTSSPRTRPVSARPAEPCATSTRSNGTSNPARPVRRPHPLTPHPPRRGGRMASVRRYRPKCDARVPSSCRVPGQFVNTPLRVALAREHGRNRVQERRGAQATRRGRATRRLQAAAIPADRVRRQPRPAGWLPPCAAPRARARATARRPTSSTSTSASRSSRAGCSSRSCARQAARRSSLRRLGHPRQDARAARVRAAGRRARRRVVRRDPLGARCRRDPTGHRPHAVHAVARTRRRAAAGRRSTRRRARRAREPSSSKPRARSCRSTSTSSTA